MSKTPSSHLVTVVTPDTERSATSRVATLVSLLLLWRWRLRCRRELSILTPEQMRDTGLDPGTVRRESRKPFWKA
jgi:uncharacterized protein YjiS (DUF1127 family)